MLIRLLCPFQDKAFDILDTINVGLEKSTVPHWWNGWASEIRETVAYLFDLRTIFIDQIILICIKIEKIKDGDNTYKDNHENHTKLNNLKWFFDHFWFLLICLSKSKCLFWNDYNMCYLIERKRFCFLIKSMTFL